MAKTQGYDNHSAPYDAWFDGHPAIYQTELNAVQSLLPTGVGIEIGAGTGRFSIPLKIDTGIEPSAAMRDIARARGKTMLDGVAENLPVNNQTFDFALFVTSVCFLDDPLKAFKEVKRVIKPNGHVLIAFIEKNSSLGQTYEQHKQESPYYCDATFYSTQELLDLLKTAGFTTFETCQTLFADLPQDQIQPTKPGHDQGAFVVIKAQ